MLVFMIVLLIILSILLMLVVLVQPGKGDMISGMGSLGGTFSNMLGSRRAMGMLSKVTVGLAAAVLVLSLVTNYFFVGQETEVPKPIIEGTQLPSTVPSQAPQQIPQLPDQNQNNNDEGEEN